MTQRLLEEICSAIRSSGRPRVPLSPALTEAAWATGCARVRRAFLGREGSAAGALLEQLAARCRLGAPGAGGGAWRGCRPLPVIGLLCCNFARALLGAAPPPSRSEPLPRESLRLRFGPGRGGCSRCRLAGETQGLRGSLAVASLKEGSSVRAMPNRPGPVSAQAGGRVPRVREGTRAPRTLAARQRRARNGSPSSFHLSPTGTG